MRAIFTNSDSTVYEHDHNLPAIVVEHPSGGDHRGSAFQSLWRSWSAQLKENSGESMQTSSSGDRVRIAVIDDDTTFLELMHDLLQEEGGYEVLICREWQDAYHFVKQQRPALVILDIRIGDEERGWTILELLTLDPETRSTHVIVCSAAIHSLHNHQTWLDRFGICALPKPFDIDVLLETVARSLS